MYARVTTPEGQAALVVFWDAAAQLAHVAVTGDDAHPDRHPALVAVHDAHRSYRVEPRPAGWPGLSDDPPVRTRPRTLRLMSA